MLDGWIWNCKFNQFISSSFFVEFNWWYGWIVLWNCIVESFRWITNGWLGVNIIWNLLHSFYLQINIIRFDFPNCISNSSSATFERPCNDVRLPKNMPSELTAVENFKFSVDSLFDSNTGIPVVRNANFSHANHSRIINGVVYDSNLTTLSSHAPTLVEKEFELPTFVQPSTPLLSEIVPTWPSAVERKWLFSIFILIHK